MAATSTVDDTAPNAALFGEPRVAEAQAGLLRSTKVENTWRGGRRVQNARGEDDGMQQRFALAFSALSLFAFVAALSVAGCSVRGSGGPVPSAAAPRAVTEIRSDVHTLGPVCLESPAAGFIPAALGIVACAGVPSSTATVPPLPQQLQLLNRNLPTASCLTMSCIYVANYTGNSLTAYPRRASGNTAPVEVVSGSNTGLDHPSAIVLDRHDVYVSNQHCKPPSCSGSVTVYAAGANGNVAPVRTISGSNTLLGATSGITRVAGVNLFVTTGKYCFSSSGDVKCYGTDRVTVYPTTANGNVAPIRTISGSNTGLDFAAGIALDANRNAYVANDGPPIPSPTYSVTVYAAGANGNVSPTRTISGSNTGLAYPTSVAVDSSGNTYVANAVGGASFLGSVTVYAPGANGNVAPIRTISGANTMLVGASGIALDARRQIYVTNQSSPPSVTVYAAGANGDVPPIQLISGSKTALTTAFGIAVH